MVEGPYIVACVAFPEKRGSWCLQAVFTRGRAAASEGLGTGAGHIRHLPGLDFEAPLSGTLLSFSEQSLPQLGLLQLHRGKPAVSSQDLGSLSSL